MNFDEAIKAHVDWKMKLSAYIKKPDKTYNPDQVALDNQCSLGKWIYGDGAIHSKHAEFESLKKEHANFHKCAADIIRKADKGENVTEELAFNAKSPYSMASNAVTRHLMELRRKVGA